jgi:hypothetical protein
MKIRKFLRRPVKNPAVPVPAPPYKGKHRADEDHTQMIWVNPYGRGYELT